MSINAEAVRGCTCGAGEDRPEPGHDELCRAPQVTIYRLVLATNGGRAAGFTDAEQQIVLGVIALMKERHGLGGDAERGHIFIRDAAAKICGGSDRHDTGTWG